MDLLCDQSTFENLQESLNSSLDLVDCIQMELSERPARSGEQELLIDLEEAIQSLQQCCNTVIRNACEELVWGRMKHPRRVDASGNSVDSSDESQLQDAATEFLPWGFPSIRK